MVEIWKPIPNYEGLYEVSNFGFVRSLDRVTKNGRKIKGKVKRLSKNQNGYLYVCLYKNGARKNCLVHRLVMIAFNGESEGGLQINHRNEIKICNILTNLEYVTPKKNTNYGTGTERMAATKKTPVVCVETGTVYDGIRDAERATGIRNSSISAVCKGKRNYNTAGGYHWRYVK